MLRRYSIIDPVRGRTIRTVRTKALARFFCWVHRDVQDVDYDESRFALRWLTDQAPRETLHAMMDAARR